MMELAPPSVIIPRIRIELGAYFSTLGRWSNTETLCELILIRASHLSDRGMFSHTDNMLAAHNDLIMLIKLLKSEDLDLKSFGFDFSIKMIKIFSDSKFLFVRRSGKVLNLF